MKIDGSFGEGGGQILRTSMSLAAITGTPIVIERIRRGRKKPGLQRQHLAAVRAVSTICGGRLEGDELKSPRLAFEPGPVRGGAYRFDIGSAGSAALVLQTVLPPLLQADAASELVIIGGTHNIQAPPYDFLAQTYLPLLKRMGAQLHLKMVRPGFYPTGGGEIRCQIHPSSLGELQLMEASLPLLRARAVVAKLPERIGERELQVLEERLDVAESKLEVENRSESPGNVLFLEVIREELTELLTGFGERGKPAHRVAKALADRVESFLAAEVPVGEHLADQLLLPMALGAGGRYRTVAPSPHTTTQIEIIRRFLDVEIECLQVSEDVAEISVRPSGVP